MKRQNSKGLSIDTNVYKADLKSFIIVKWNSILLSIGSMVTGALLVFVEHKIFMAIVFIMFGLLKIVGLFGQMHKIRLSSLVGINIIWAVLSVTFFVQSHFFTGTFAALICFFGIGVAIQERFK